MSVICVDLNRICIGNARRKSDSRNSRCFYCLSKLRHNIGDIGIISSPLETRKLRAFGVLNLINILSLSLLYVLEVLGVGLKNKKIRVQRNANSCIVQVARGLAA